MYAYDDNDYAITPHPACPGGCGELADECTCRRRARVVVPPVDYAFDTDAFPARCRRSSCREDAIARGYCDVHLGDD